MLFFFYQTQLSYKNIVSNFQSKKNKLPNII